MLIGEHTSLIEYDVKYQKEVLLYLKRIPVQEFKKIDEKRISSQFNVLQSSHVPKSNDILYFNKENKDRYSCIVPYKHNRVNIQGINNFYVNASFMRSVLDHQMFAIFAQAPLEQTFEHFWFSIYNFDVKKIFMLCGLGHQADKYWPNLDSEVKFQNLNITVTCVLQNLSNPHCQIRIFSLKGKDGQKMVQHIHWKSWGDMGIPSNQMQVNIFWQLIQEALKLIENKQLFLVHCSAGIGRTGTFGAALEAVRCFSKRNELSLFEIVDNLRRNREGSVQTFQQYSFLYSQIKKFL